MARRGFGVRTIPTDDRLNSRGEVGTAELVDVGEIYGAGHRRSRPRIEIPLKLRVVAALAIMAVMSAVFGSTTLSVNLSSRVSVYKETSQPLATESGVDNSHGRSAVIRVPADAPTIQAGVDKASRGTLVLVSPGIYKEALRVTRSGIVIRGIDRNRTVLDGEFQRDIGVNVVGANGVTVENLTARNYTLFGFYWQQVDGYRGSYLNALRDGQYGIYAFQSTHGELDHAYAAGSSEAGFYIGSCGPCSALIADVDSAWNGQGLSIENVNNGVSIARSRFYENRAGIVLKSSSGAPGGPEQGVTLVGNSVYRNDNSAAPGVEFATRTLGDGIVVVGGSRNTIRRNLVIDNRSIGIAVVALPKELADIEGNPRDFDARANHVQNNVTRGSRRDLVLIGSLSSQNDPGGNCFSGNTFRTSLPSGIQRTAPCGRKAAVRLLVDPSEVFALLKMNPAQSPSPTNVQLPAPGALPNMPRPRDG